MDSSLSTDTAFSVCSFIGVILMSISLPWHLQYCKSLSCSVPYSFIPGSTIHSMEYRNMRVYALDRFWMSHPLHQLHSLDRQCDQLGTCMVRYRYISTFRVLFVVTNIDTASHYIVGGSIGIPASSLCIIRRLYYITKLQSLSQDSKQVKFCSLDVS